MKLAEVDRTHMQRTAIALVEVIGSIHQTVKEYAVLDSEHVTRLVRENFAAPSEHESTPIRRLSSMKLRIVARKAEDADTLAKRCLTEDEIPRWAGIEITHRDCNRAERVRWQSAANNAQYIAR